MCLEKYKKFKKQNTLIQMKFKTLSMEDKYAYLWWDAIQDIVQKDIKKVYRRYVSQPYFGQVWG